MIGAPYVHLILTNILIYQQKLINSPVSSFIKIRYEVQESHADRMTDRHVAKRIGRFLQLSVENLQKYKVKYFISIVGRQTRLNPSSTNSTEIAVSNPAQDNDIPSGAKANGI
jgi:hypothetical protein